MAANTYLLDAGSTFKGAAITSGTSFSWSYNTNPTSLSSDGSRYVNLTVVDNLSATISVECYDANLAANANFKPGASGALVLKTKLRGAGDSTSTAMTITFTEAVCVGYQAAAPNDSAGGITITFNAYDSDGNGSLVAYS